MIVSLAYECKRFQKYKKRLSSLKLGVSSFLCALLVCWFAGLLVCSLRKSKHSQATETIIVIFSQTNPYTKRYATVPMVTF